MVRFSCAASLEKIENIFQGIRRSSKLKARRKDQVKVEAPFTWIYYTACAEDVSQDMYGSIDLVVIKLNVKFVRINKNRKENC